VPSSLLAIFSTWAKKQCSSPTRLRWYEACAHSNDTTMAAEAISPCTHNPALFTHHPALQENRTKVKLLAIRERELSLYTNNCRTVGTVSALMAGIAYSALIYTKMAYFQESPLVQQFLYISGLVVCMCLSLRNVFGTTLLTMLGPGKALRGPDGSMHSAVDGMLELFESIVIVQHLTIYSFMVTAFVYAWGAATMSFISSLVLSALIASMAYTMYIRTRVAESSFPLRRIPLVSGAFFPKQSAAPTNPRTEPDPRQPHDEQQAADGGAQGHVTHQHQPPPALPPFNSRRGGGSHARQGAELM
jgi:hypothetical protein